MDAERCWYGARNGAINGVMVEACDFERSDEVRRRASNRGGIVMAVELAMAS